MASYTTSLGEFDCGIRLSMGMVIGVGLLSGFDLMELSSAACDCVTCEGTKHLLYYESEQCIFCNGTGLRRVYNKRSELTDKQKKKSEKKN